MRFYPALHGKHREPELTGQTLQTMLWIAESPRTTAQLVTLLHLDQRSVTRRLSHLRRHGLAQTTGDLHSITEKAVNLMRGDIS